MLPETSGILEKIGTYDPKRPGHNSSLNLERAEYWISKGAQPSDTVRSLIKKIKKTATAAETSSQPERETAESIPNEVSAASPQTPADSASI